MPSDEPTDTTLPSLHSRDPACRHIALRRCASIAASLLFAATATTRPTTAAPAETAVFAPVVMDSHAHVGADDDPERVREIVLWFRYAGLVDTYLSARSADDRLYLPLRELFGLLRIHCELDSDAGTAQGHIMADERPYRIDFTAGTAEVAGLKHVFHATAFVAGERDVFVSPGLLQEWFGLEFELNSGEMVLSLRSGEDLPIMRMNRRSAQRPDLYDPYAAMRHAPLSYNRLRRNLGGGTLDYGLSFSQDASGTLLNVDAAVGAEILGGDLRWRAGAGHAGSTYFNQSEFLWRYVREDEYLSQVRVGSAYSTGLEPVAYHGVHLTNAPAVPRTYFAEYQVAGDAPADWDVEVYLDDRLVGMARADVAGRYRFTVPISYGTSMIRVRMYGPSGEEREDLQRIQVPFNLLAPGETRYNLHAGRARNSRHWMTQGDVGYGINERLSVTAGVDLTPRFDPIRSAGGLLERDVVQAPLPYAGVTSRIGRHYLAGLDVSPGGYSRVSLSGFHPTHASVELQGIRFGRASALLVDGRRHMMRAGGFMPFAVRGRPASIRLHAAQTNYDDGSTFGLGTSVYAGFNRLRLHLAGRGEWSDAYDHVRISPTVSYTVASREHELFRHLDGMVVAARADYEVNSGRFERLNVDAGHNIRPRTRLSVTLDTGLHGAPTSIGFRLSADLASARATTTGRVRSTGSSVTQSVRGSVVFDEPNRAFHFDRRPAVGRSSAAVRIFIDEDGDGRFDPAEPLLDDDAIQLRHGSSGFKRRAGSITLLSGLLPYERYTASVDEALLSNPMLVPSRPAFSFIADPNTVKPIDVPLTAAGVVEGRVMEVRGQVSYPVSGAVVRLVRLEDGLERVLQTFSDGTFYEMGLPPGTYDIVLDDESGADLIVAPASHTITIKPALNGEYVDGLDFMLRREHPAGLRPLQTACDACAEDITLRKASP